MDYDPFNFLLNNGYTILDFNRDNPVTINSYDDGCQYDYKYLDDYVTVIHINKQRERVYSLFPQTKYFPKLLGITSDHGIVFEQIKDDRLSDLDLCEVSESDKVKILTNILNLMKLHKGYILTPNNILVDKELNVKWILLNDHSSFRMPFSFTTQNITNTSSSEILVWNFGYFIINMFNFGWDKKHFLDEFKFIILDSYPKELKKYHDIAVECCQPFAFNRITLDKLTETFFSII